MEKADGSTTRTFSEGRRGRPKGSKRGLDLIKKKKSPNWGGKIFSKKMGSYSEEGPKEKKK